MTETSSVSKSDSGDERHHDHLEAIFVKVTGTDELVEEQSQSADDSRELTVDGESQSQTLSEYVSSMVRDDGLSETFAEPASQNPPD